jgi:hypothetical protein
VPLEEVAEGYRAMDEWRAIKTLLRPINQGDGQEIPDLGIIAIGKIDTGVEAFAVPSDG